MAENCGGAGKLVHCVECEHFEEHTRDNFYCSKFKKVYEAYCCNHGSCQYYRRKQMPEIIKITVEVNGQSGTLADVSKETLLGMREKSEITVRVKPIEHGDYGYNDLDPRLFVKNHKTGKIDAWDTNANWACDDVNTKQHHSWYTITGNIFKDLQNG